MTLTPKTALPTAKKTRMNVPTASVTSLRTDMAVPHVGGRLRSSVGSGHEPRQTHDWPIRSSPSVRTTTTLVITRSLRPLFLVSVASPQSDDYVEERVARSAARNRGVDGVGD